MTGMHKFRWDLDHKLRVPAHQIQVDVKFLKFEGKGSKPVKRYQYTAIDDATRRALCASVLSLFVCAHAAHAWVPLGPDGGTVRVIAVDPGNPSTLYAAVFAGPNLGDGRGVGYMGTSTLLLI